MLIACQDIFDCRLSYKIVTLGIKVIPVKIVTPDKIIT